MSELWDNATTNTTTANQSTEGDRGSGFGKRFHYHPVIDDGYSSFNIFEIAFLSAILVISSVGNGYVLYASSMNVIKRKYARLHMLVVSLALSDFLQGPCQVVPQLVSIILKTWSLGDSFCRVHALTRSMLANVSISTLSIITMERFLNVESIDGNAHLTLYACAVVCVWVLQAALAAPLSVWNIVVTYGPLRKCHIPFSTLPETLDYTVAVRVVAFFCPLGILWIGNLGVIYKLRRMDRRIIPLATGVTMNTMRKRRSRKVTITCLMLAIMFTVNLTPFQVALLIVQTADFQLARSVLSVLSHIWLLTVLNCCVNPFVYGFFLQNLKQRILQSCFCPRLAEFTPNGAQPPKRIANLLTSSNAARNSDTSNGALNRTIPALQGNTNNGVLSNISGSIGPTHFQKGSLQTTAVETGDKESRSGPLLLHIATNRYTSPKHSGTANAPREARVASVPISDIGKCDHSAG